MRAEFIKAHRFHIFGILLFLLVAALFGWESQRQANLDSWNVKMREARKALQEGNTSIAIESFEKALSEARSWMRPTAQLATTCIELGTVYLKDENRVNDGDKLFREAFEIRRVLFGTQDLELADISFLLASVYTERKEYRASAALLLESLKVREAALGSDHPLLIDNLSALVAVCLREHEFLPEACPSNAALYRRIAEIAFKRYPENHSNLQKAMYPFADQYLGRGQHEQRLAVRLAAASIAESLYGTISPQNAQALRPVVESYRYLKLWRQAESVLEKILDIGKRLNASDPPDTSDLKNLANVYIQEGRLSEGERLYEQITLIEQNIFGPDGLDRIPTLQEYASVLRQLKSTQKMRSIETLIAKIRDREVATRIRPLATRRKEVAYKQFQLRDSDTGSFSLSRENYECAEQMLRRVAPEKEVPLLETTGPITSCDVSSTGIAITVSSLQQIFRLSKKGGILWVREAMGNARYSSAIALGDEETLVILDMTQYERQQADEVEIMNASGVIERLGSVPFGSRLRRGIDGRIFVIAPLPDGLSQIYEVLVPKH